MVVLKRTLTPLDKTELNGINDNWQSIKRAFDNIDWRISILAGGEDVEKLVQDLLDAVEDARQKVNEAIVSANEKIDDKLTQQQTELNLAVEGMKAEYETLVDETTAAILQLNDVIEKGNEHNTTMEENNAHYLTIKSDFEQIKSTAETLAADTTAALDKLNQFKYMGEWSKDIDYLQYNQVVFNGSTYQAIRTNKDKSPINNTDDWFLSARAGIDGTGSVVSVNGIAPNEDGDVTLPMPKVEGGLNYFATAATRNFTTLVLDINLGDINELTQLTIQVKKNAWVNGSVSKLKFLDGTEKEIRRIGESTPVSLKREDYPENMDVILQTFRYDGTTFFVAAPKATGAKVPTVKITNQANMLSSRVAVGDVLTYVDKVPIDGKMYSHNYAPSSGVNYTDFISVRMFDYVNDTYGNLVFHGVKSYNRWTFYWYSNNGNQEINSYNAEKVLLAYQTSQNTALVVLKMTDHLKIYQFVCDDNGLPNGISDLHLNLSNDINDDDIIIDYNRQTSVRAERKYLYLNLGKESIISIVEIYEGTKEIRYFGDADVRSYSKAVATSDGLIYQDNNNKSLYIVENNGGSGKLSLAIDGMPLESLGLTLLSSDGNDNIIVNVSASNSKGLLPYWLIDRTKQNSTELNLSNITSFDLPNSSYINDIVLVSKQNKNINDIYLLVLYNNNGVQYNAFYLKAYLSYNLKRNNEKTTLAIPVVMNFNLASNWGVKTGNQPVVTYIGENQSGKYELTKTYEAEYNYWHEINNVSLIDGLSLMPFISMPYAVPTTPKAFTLINHKNNDYEGVLGKNLKELYNL